MKNWVNTQHTHTATLSAGERDGNYEARTLHAGAKADRRERGMLTPRGMHSSVYCYNVEHFYHYRKCDITKYGDGDS